MASLEPAGEPQMFTDPAVGLTRPHAIFTSVDFPAPLGPISPTSSPGSIDIETPARARVAL